jgi:hypothetical protein
MASAAPTITVYFGTSNNSGTALIIEDPVRGLIESATYTIGGDVGTQVRASEVSIRRGRSRELDEYTAGTCTFSVFDLDRTYDDTNTASALVGQVTPGKRMSVSVWGQTIFVGQVEDWEHTWTVDHVDEVQAFAVDGLGELALREFDEWTTTGSQTAGDRLTDALNRGEVNYGIARDLDTGVTSLQSDLVTWGSNVLNYLQLVAKSDAGRLFATRENVLRYQDRLSLVNPDTGIMFTDDGTGTVFHAITTASQADLLFNRVGVDREGGTLQTQEDLTSQEALGIRQLNLSGLLMDSDDQADSLAGWLLGNYRTPTTRIASVAVKLNDDRLTGAQRGALARLDLGDVVSVSWTPGGVGDPLEQLLVVEGVAHDINATGVHVMTISLSIAQQVGVFVIEDPVYGLIETGGVLAF